MIHIVNCACDVISMVSTLYISVAMLQYPHTSYTPVTIGTAIRSNSSQSTTDTILTCNIASYLIGSCLATCVSNFYECAHKIFMFLLIDVIIE